MVLSIAWKLIPEIVLSEGLQQSALEVRDFLLTFLEVSNFSSALLAEGRGNYDEVILTNATLLVNEK